MRHLPVQVVCFWFPAANGAFGLLIGQAPTVGSHRYARHNAGADIDGSVSRPIFNRCRLPGSACGRNDDIAGRVEQPRGCLPCLPAHGPALVEKSGQEPFSLSSSPGLLAGRVRIAQPECVPHPAAVLVAKPDGQKGGQEPFYSQVPLILLLLPARRRRWRRRGGSSHQGPVASGQSPTGAGPCRLLRGPHRPTKPGQAALARGS